MKNKNLRLYLLAIALFALILGGVSYYYYSLKLKEGQANPVVAEVRGEKIYLSEYTEILNESNGGKLDEYIKEPLLQELVELEILEIFFEKEGLQVESDGGPHTRLEKLREKFKNEFLIWKEGYALFCRYDRGLQGDYEEKLNEAQKLVESQKSYAEDYCNQAKIRLENSSEFNDELKRLEADETIGAKAWEPWSVSFGTEFGKRNYKKEYFETTFDLFSKISATKIPLNKVTIISSKHEESARDGMYALVKVTSENSKGETADYAKWLEDQAKSLNVKVYPEKIK